MTTQVSYRMAGPADAPVLAELGRITFLETFAHLYRPDDLAAFLATHDEALWAAQLADPATRVRLAEAAGEAIGYARLGRPSFAPELLRDGERAIELKQLYLRASWQGRGVADALMDWAVAETRGFDALYLLVYPDNRRARRFYERYGFVQVGEAPFHVGSQVDHDLVLRKALA